MAPLAPPPKSAYADIQNAATYSNFNHHLKSFLFSVAYRPQILSYSFLGFIIHFLYC